MLKSTRNKILFTGCFTAALLIGILAATGFQESMKLGMVDLGRVITESKLRNEATVQIETAGNVRQAILSYMQTEQYLTKAQCERLRTLELKEDKTDAEIVEIQTIKIAVTSQVKEFDDIIGASGNLSDEQNKRLGELVAGKNTTATLWEAWGREFEQEFQAIAQNVDREAVAKAQTACQAVAKREGYTLVFSNASVVYSANDITEQAILEANK